MMQGKSSYKRRGMTIIGFLFVAVIVGLIIAFVFPAIGTGYKHLGLFGAILWGAIPMTIIIVGVMVFYKILEFLSPSPPEYCELKKCRLRDCYHVLLGVSRQCVRQGACKFVFEIFMPIQYFKCRCGKEYINYAHDVFTKITEDGRMTPYKRNLGPLGWRDDKSEYHIFAIPMDILQQLRNESTDSSFVTRQSDCKGFYLELRTHCSLLKSDYPTEVCGIEIGNKAE